ncbi:hypothetical protein Vadar_024581 [Vaccinium darrowii]|uniref:Uncharacterized protein n=1 Tax=Vaccinium darrowii TaxID=229202 RepID=A0ACB7XSU0_9ERIC|nr:hypothetical protein Vadar_024581 [Vaccinium darrowii]
MVSILSLVNVPRVKLSMYASVTSVIPFIDDTCKTTGYIVGRCDKAIEKFTFDHAKSTTFDTCNNVWKMMSIEITDKSLNPVSKMKLFDAFYESEAEMCSLHWDYMRSKHADPSSKMTELLLVVFLMSIIHDLTIHMLPGAYSSTQNVKMKMKKMERGTDLANPGFVIFEISISPWNQSEIDDGDESIVKDIPQAIDDEVGTVWTESFIVE